MLHLKSFGRVSQQIFRKLPETHFPSQFERLAKPIEFKNFCKALDPVYPLPGCVKNALELSQTTSSNNTQNEPVLDSEKTENNKSSIPPGWNKLIHITDENYKAVLSEHKNLFILFHASWCFYCKDAKFEFSSLAEDLDMTNWTLAACDADKGSNVVDDLFVASLPTFKFIRNGVPFQDYQGDRNRTALKRYLTEVTNSEGQVQKLQ